MAIELRYEMAIALVVVAALLDGVDGRLARALKAQSKFGAELDSLADFVNFGVAPAVIVFIWGLGGLPRGFGWIVALVFALATGLRLARFNTMIDVEKPKWQSEYFTGMPAPAGAITVLLPLYLDGLGLFDVRSWPWLIALYTAGHGGPAGVDHPHLLGQAPGRADLARVRAAGLRRRRRAGGAAGHLPLRHADAGHACSTWRRSRSATIASSRSCRSPRRSPPPTSPAIRLPGDSPPVDDLPAGETKH